MANEQKEAVGKALATLDTDLAVPGLLPANLPSPKFMRLVRDTLNRTPDLRECTPASILDAVRKAAADGLQIDGREAALIVFNKRAQVNGKWDVVAREAQYIPMVAGLRRRIFNSGMVSALATGIVYEKEVEAGSFEWQEGTDAHLIHKPLLSGELGEPVAVYSVVTMSNGTKSVEVMRWPEVMRIAALQSKNVARQDDTRRGIRKGELVGIWRDHLHEMARKTVLRRHSKQLPFDSETARVFERVDDLYRSEGDAPYEEGETIDNEEPPRTPPKKAGAGRDKLRAAGVAKQEVPAEPIEEAEIVEDDAGNTAGDDHEDDRI